MRKNALTLAGAMTAVLVGCGPEAAEGSSDDGPAPSEEVGVSTSKLTNCTRTELANEVVACGGANFTCFFRLMESNFACDEGIVGQASTETLSGTASTVTTVATLLFGKQHEGSNGGWITPVTIATQWGHAFASSHTVFCQDPRGVWQSARWTMDPWSERARKDNSSGGLCL